MCVDDGRTNTAVVTSTITQVSTALVVDSLVTIVTSTTGITTIPTTIQTLQSLETMLTQ
jgi:hypothetical protein